MNTSGAGIAKCLKVDNNLDGTSKKYYSREHVHCLNTCHFSQYKKNTNFE